MSKSMLTFLGRSSGFGLKNTSAFIDLGNRLILIDCGITVFPMAIEVFDFSKYDDIDIIITHLHPDHAGSLGQLIMYLGYVVHKNVNVLSACKEIRTFLDISGVDSALYNQKNNCISGLQFIPTKHVDQLDSYGFKLQIEGKTILYTGDTKTLAPFLPYVNEADEFYVEASCTGGVHLKITDILDTLEGIQLCGTKVYLMHIDDESKMSEIVKGSIEFAPLI